MKCSEEADKLGQVRVNFAMTEPFGDESGAKQHFNNIVAGYLAMLAKKQLEERVRLRGARH